ncbi:pilus assembly protein [Methyloradius palustris]|uniref:PilY1 beta-propeller domain-containing protein n=1 Tax=Methyloradius palustris TaxID=2778876 RepID=A0A8D5G5M7_9PROT|nr:PilC/PilY family type IV pilus protein [Methyloradius palustris]BCM26145.1 hypothetical protein ZMTM_24040 [Methyloradius palustris]
MNINKFFKNIAGVSTLLVLLSGTSNADVTKLATQPITTQYTSQQVLPNIMFVLDDSFSMSWAYLPDWANVLIPHLFSNSAFNGVAYNPAINYTPPTMYDEGGNVDKTTYPSQNAINTATFTATPAWTKVPKDRYGVQYRIVNPTTVDLVNDPKNYGNLVGNVNYYTTIAGEFCDSPLLRNCKTTKDTIYKYEAKLRWCHTAAEAIAPTSSADATATGGCQAKQIVATTTNTNNSVTSYTYFRAPSPGGISNITFSGAGSTTISGISVGTIGATAVSAQILSQPITTTVSSVSGLLNAIVTQINNCTAVATGNCNVSGYSAFYDGGNTLIISAPSATTNSPAITQNSTNTPQFNITTNITASATAFTATPGSVFKTSVVGILSTYGYACVAGTTGCAKAPNRTDCASTLCTYSEEMTNYANWYAYYQTRMQMMKTVVSQAFDLTESQFRVGYFTINNGTQDPLNVNKTPPTAPRSEINDYLDITTFSNPNKYLWYTQLFRAYPTGQTPLRTALSNAGKIYANLLPSSTLNSRTVSDPVQYSCQQNYTILSTDGYWNESATPTQLDGSAIGEQDGNEPRPYYDGATVQQIIQQTTQTVDQVATNTNFIMSKTTQQTKSTSNLHQNQRTFYIYPYQVDTKNLQKATSTLQASYNTLTSVTSVLQQTTNLLQQTTYDPIKKIYPVETVTVKPIQTKYSLQQRTYTPRSTVYPLQQNVATRNEQDTLLKQTARKLQVYTRNLQKETVSTADGNVNDTGWLDVPAGGTCIPGTTNSGSTTTVVTCQYVDATSPQYVDSTASDGSCTPIAQSGYTTRTVVACQYADGNVTQNLNTCTAGTPSSGSGKWLPYNACAYQAQGSKYPLTSTTASLCVAHGADTSSPYSKQVSCTYVQAGWVAASQVASVPTCTAGTSIDQLTQTSCQYSATKSSGPTSTSGTCTVHNQTASPYTGDKVLCDYNGTTPDAAYANTTATCNTTAKSTTSTSNNAQYVVAQDCQYNSTAETGAGAATSVTTCNESYSTGPAWSIIDKVSCTYPSSTTIQSQAATSIGQACISGGAVPSSEAANSTSYGSINQCRFATSPSNGTNGASAVPCQGSAGSLINGTALTTCEYPSTATTTKTYPTITSCSSSPRNPAAGTTTTSANLTTATECQYVQGTAANVTSGTCSDVSLAAGLGYTKTCSYAQTSTNTNATSCARIDQQSAQPWSLYTIRSCTYSANSALADVTATNCTVGSPSNGGNGTNYVGPITNTCQYSAYSLFSDASSCAVVARDAGPTYTTKTAVNCQYAPAVTTYAGTCTVKSEAGFVNAQAVACTLLSTAQTVEQTSLATSADVSSCTPSSISTSNVPNSGVTRRVDTACAYNAFTTPVASACANTDSKARDSIVNGVAATTATKCDVVTNPGIPTNSVVDANEFVNVPSCTPVATATPLFTFDANGKNVQCLQTTNTADTFVPVSTCTPNTTSVGAGPNYLQTNCVSKQHSVTFVPACTPSTTSDYVTTTCQSLPPVATNIAVCTPRSPTFDNGYQTITCSTAAGTGTSNTLADVAEYYYKTDLRTYSLGNCVGAPVTAADGTTTINNAICANASPDSLNNVAPTGADLNTAQHMTTFTLGLGASGFMQYTQKYANSVENGGSPDYASVATDTTAVPASGICSWQNSGTCNWPFPLTNDQSGIDDLWHAGINGRGDYYSATDPTSLANSINTALSTVNNARGSSTGLSTSSANVTSVDNFAFSTSFASGSWDGEVIRKQIDPNTGLTTSRIDWAAQSKLDNRSVSSRVIYTFDSTNTSTNLKNFTVNNFGTDPRFNKATLTNSTTGIAQFTCAKAVPCIPSTSQDAAAGAALVNYLIGDRSNEGAVTDNAKYFRQRSHVLGDIVNSPVTYVGPPKYSYADAGYSKFAADKANRLSLAIVGANDGMLHAFRAQGSATAEAALKATIADPGDAAKATANIQAQNSDISQGIDAGQELWAYIPSVLLKDLYKLASKDYSTYHRYFVDGIQEVGDICTSSCDSTDNAVWKTILIGGLGGGGRVYYALDITDPNNPKALWEYSTPNLGYTYGNPQIAKQSDGKWVVLFSSGYNNVPDATSTGGDGVGRLFVVDANTGIPTQTQTTSGVSTVGVSTGFGSTASPSGLSKIVAQVTNGNTDASMKAVYGGDMYGNLWRFDTNQLTSTSPVPFIPFKSTAQLMATFKDTAGNLQPLTAKPTLGIVDTYTVVYAGTGAYLDATDVAKVTTQSFYAVKDPGTTTASGTAIYSDPRSSFVQQTQSVGTCPLGISALICTAGDPVRTSSSNLVDYTTKGGWYFDLPVAGERANTDPSFDLNLLIFNTNIPTTLACNLGGYSFQYQVDYRTGGPASGSTSGVVAFKLGNQLASGATVYTTSSSATGGGSGKTGTILGGNVINKGTLDNPTPADTRRTSWRELITH